MVMVVRMVPMRSGVAGEELVLLWGYGEGKWCEYIHSSPGPDPELPQLVGLWATGDWKLVIVLEYTNIMSQSGGAEASQPSPWIRAWLFLHYPTPRHTTSGPFCLPFSNENLHVRLLNTSINQQCNTKIEIWKIKWGNKE